MKPNSTPEELKTFMSSLGFYYDDGTYYQCFKKEEGNCEITMTGAKDLQKSFQRKQLEARIDELNKVRILSVSGHYPEITVWSGDKQLKLMGRVAELKALKEKE